MLHRHIAVRQAVGKASIEDIGTRLRRRKILNRRTRFGRGPGTSVVNDRADPFGNPQGENAGDNTPRKSCGRRPRAVQFGRGSRAALRRRLLHILSHHAGVDLGYLGHAVLLLCI